MKRVLDVCCGSRMMWFDKENPNTVFMDIRSEQMVCCDGRTVKIKPNVQADFTAQPFLDGCFDLVVFDPPHLKNLGKNSWIAQKYGVLLPSWETDLKAAFDESMRVLKSHGVLIFKWSEIQISVSRVLEVLEKSPLFGHPTSKSGKTKWVAFLKD